MAHKLPVMWTSIYTCMYLIITCLYSDAVQFVIGQCWQQIDCSLKKYCTFGQGERVFTFKGIQILVHIHIHTCTGIQLYNFGILSIKTSSCKYDYQ